MAEQPDSKKTAGIDPKQISAWIALGSTVFGLLNGLVTASGSTYGPIDTVLIFIVTLAFLLYAVTFATALLLGLSTQFFGEGFLNNPITLVIAGILILVIAVPLGIDYGNVLVQDGLDAIGLLFARFVGVSVIVLAAWLMYKYVLTPKSQGGTGAK